MGSILVIKLSALGDLVQAEGALRDIREHHQGDRLTVMTTPPYQRFMERCPWVDEIFIDQRASRFHVPQMMRLRKRLHEQRFDRVYDLQQVGRTRFYYRWLFPKRTWLGDVPGCSFYLKRDEDRVCAADHFAAHLKIAGLNVRHTLKSNVSWMAEEVDDILVAAGLKPGFVVLMPGASAAHEGKRWPCYTELASKLRDLGKQVVTIPGPDEIELCGSIPGTMLIPDSGFYDFFKVAGIVMQASFVIGNDTGPTHIAAHLGLPGIALYGDHTPAQTTGIQHTRFEVIEQGDLADLSLDTVWSKTSAVISRLSG